MVAGVSGAPLDARHNESDAPLTPAESDARLTFEASAFL
jgi:hypothetical protein